MRLYRMELYKLYHKKAFVICSVLTVLIMIFYFWADEVGSETAMVGGENYYGYSAVRINRQITEEYKGVLTDEKVSEIVDKYGLPSEVVYDYPGWRDANYLTDFVTIFLSDGYMNDWNDYKAPEVVYAIADTELGKLQSLTGEEIQFAYTNGWKALLGTLQVGMVLASVLVILSVSVVFAQEGQTKMLPLLLTAQKGKGEDTRAKMAAAFSLTIIVYIVVVLLCLVMSACVFGLDGGECPLGVAMAGGIYFNINSSVSYMPMMSFALIVLGMDLAAMLLLCAITMCVSAHHKSTFGAVATAAVLWGIPLLISMFFGGFGYFLTSCMPLFLIMTNLVYEAFSWGREVLMFPVIVGVFVFCVGEGYRAACRLE